MRAVKQRPYWSRRVSRKFVRMVCPRCGRYTFMPSSAAACGRCGVSGPGVLRGR